MGRVFRQLGIQQNETPISQYCSGYSYILINFPNSFNFFQRLLIFAGFRDRIQVCHSGQHVSGPLKRPIPPYCRSYSNILIFFQVLLIFFLRLLVFFSFRYQILAFRLVFSGVNLGKVFWDFGIQQNGSPISHSILLLLFQYFGNFSKFY